MGDELSYPPLIPDRTSAKARLTTLKKAEFLRGLDVFSEAGVEELFCLASVAEESDFAPGQILFREDDIADAFHILVQGKVELSSEKRNVREVLGPGESAGLYSVLRRELHCATARALEETSTLVIGAEDLYNVLSNNMEIVTSLFRHFLNKLAISSEK
jgi:CRP-like cAMP-binding protein